MRQLQLDGRWAIIRQLQVLQDSLIVHPHHHVALQGDKWLELCVNQCKKAVSSVVESLFG